MLVSQGVSHCIGLSAGTEQTTEVSVGLDISDREEKQTTKEYHGLSHLLVVFTPSRPSLEEEDEVRDVTSHLRS